MSFDPRVQHLIEEVLDSGRSVEAVCHDSPELLTQVREGQSARAPDVPESLAEHIEIKSSYWQGLRFLLSETLHFFTLAEV